MERKFSLENDKHFALTYLMNVKKGSSFTRETDMRHY